MSPAHNSVIYIAQRFLYRISDFLRHWYVDGFYFVSRRAVNFLEVLDRRLALKVSVRYWLKPLYQDYTLLGYLFGFILRTFRIIAGGIVYLMVIVAAAVIYLVWAALPVYIVYRGSIGIL